MKSILSIISFIFVIISIFLLISLIIFSVPIFGYGHYLIIFSILLSSLGVIIGIISLIKIKNTNLTGKEYSIISIVLGIISFIAAIIIYNFARAISNVGLGI